MSDLQEGLQTQASPDRTQSPALGRKALPVRQMRQTLLAFRLVLAAHEPQILVLQEGSRGERGCREGGARKGPPGAHGAAAEPGVLAGHRSTRIPGAPGERAHPQRRTEREHTGALEGSGGDVREDGTAGRGVRGGGGREREQKHGHRRRHDAGRRGQRGALHGRELHGREGGIQVGPRGRGVAQATFGLYRLFRGRLRSCIMQK